MSEKGKVAGKPLLDTTVKPDVVPPWVDAEMDALRDVSTAVAV
jgi:hypothetical protein